MGRTMPLTSFYLLDRLAALMLTSAPCGYRCSLSPNLPHRWPITRHQVKLSVGRGFSKTVTVMPLAARSTTLKLILYYK